MANILPRFHQEEVRWQWECTVFHLDQSCTWLCQHQVKQSTLGSSPALPSVLLYLLHLCHSLEPCKRTSFLSWGEEKGHKRSLTSYKFSPVCISIFCSNYHCQAWQSTTCWLVSTGSLTSSLISRDSSPFLPSCSKLTPESALYTCYLLPPHFLDSHKKAVSELQSPHNISRKSEVKCWGELLQGKEFRGKQMLLNKKIKKPNWSFSDDNLQYVAKRQWGWEWE